MGLTLRRTLVVVTLVLAAGLASTLVPQSAASAWMYQPVSGSRGNVTLPTMQVNDLNALDRTNHLTFLAATGPTVYRSPAAAGAQLVKAAYQLQRWNGSTWVREQASPLIQGSIGANQIGVVMTAPYLIVRPGYDRGYFRVTWAFDWYSSTGASLGSTFVVSHLAADHQCVTRARWCQSWAGYVQVGGYFSNSW